MNHLEKRSKLHEFDAAASRQGCNSCAFPTMGARNITCLARFARRRVGRDQGGQPGLLVLTKCGVASRRAFKISATATASTASEPPTSYECRCLRVMPDL